MLVIILISVFKATYSLDNGFEMIHLSSIHKSSASTSADHFCVQEKKEG